VSGKTGKKTLRPDTTLAPVEKPETEVYVRGLPVCCLAAFKGTVVRGSGGDRRLLELRCPSCGRDWHVTSSLDDRVLERFVTHGGPRVGGSYPAA
jgi:hypothetical protein